MTIDDKLKQLKKSKFRSKFTLKEKDFKYINDKGVNVIQKHTTDFINKKLKIKLSNDGKQTPYKGHPVFIAQHATATCCRKCLFKWYGVPENKLLEEKDVTAITKIIMRFIELSINLNKSQ